MKTLAGLNTVNLSGINTFQQIVLFLLIILGSAIFVSIGVVHFRKATFERRFKAIVEEARQRRKNRTLARRSRSLSRSRPQAKDENDPEAEIPYNEITREGSIMDRPKSNAEEPNDEPGQKSVDLPAHGIPESQAITEKQTRKVPEMLNLRDEQNPSIDALRHRATFFTASSPTRERLRSPVITFQGIGARQDVMNHPRRIEKRQDYPSPLRISQPRGRSNTGSSQVFGYPGVVGRNSQFSSLTFAEREHLGGAEYRAIALLAVIVPLYFVLWQLLGVLGLGAYVANNRQAVAEGNGLSAWYEIPQVLIWHIRS